MTAPSSCFVHAADLHLDRAFRGLRSAPAATTFALGQAPLAAWDALVQLTINQRAAFLLLAGDICDGAERAVPVQLRLLEGLQRLSAEGIRTFIVLGDDDPVERWIGIREWPKGVHCFGSRDAESVAVAMAGGQVATIHGISRPADRAQNPVSRFKRGFQPGIHIGLLHTSVSPDEGDAAHHCSIGDLRAAGMDYWALGHDHRHRRLSEGQPWVVYPGTLQGRDLTGDETGPKGAVVVTVTDGRISDVRHHALEAVRLARVQVDASTLAGASELRSALAATVAGLHADCSDRVVVAACDVVGRAPAWLRAQPADALWDRLLEDHRQGYVTGDVWWDCLLDLTETVEISAHPEVSGHIHQAIEALRRAPEHVKRLLSDQGVPIAPSAFTGQSSLDSIEIGELLGRAERVALSILERREP